MNKPKIEETKKKLKILIVHNEYQIHGGEDTVVDNEVELLRAHGHEVVEYRRSNQEYKDANKGTLVKVAKNTVFNRTVYREVTKLIKTEKPDVIHVHNTFTVVSPAVYYAAQKAGVPVVQTIHNFRFFCINALLYRDGKPCELCSKGALKPGIQHKCYHDSKLQSMLCAYTLWHHRRKGIYSKLHYICLTEFGKEKLLGAMNAYIKPEQVTVLPNFVADYRPKIKEEGKYYICVSRLDITKGVKLLAEKWPEDTSKRLLICGDGPVREELENYIKETGKNIELLGQVEHDRVLDLIAGAKALIFPSLLYETFGMTIAEAAMLGTPVIANDIGNGASLVRQMSPDTVIHLVDGFGDVLNQELKSKYGIVYRRWYEENTSEEKHYRNLIGVYSQI